MSNAQDDGGRSHVEVGYGGNDVDDDDWSSKGEAVSGGLAAGPPEAIDDELMTLENSETYERRKEIVAVEAQFGWRRPTDRREAPQSIRPST